MRTLLKKKIQGCLVGVMIRFFILSTIVFLHRILLIVWTLDYLKEKFSDNHQNTRKFSTQGIKIIYNFEYPIKL